MCYSSHNLFLFNQLCYIIFILFKHASIKVYTQSTEIQNKKKNHFLELDL